MNFEPKISIIIVNYNGQDFLTDCLESVLKSDYPDFEVILVDNNSSDDSINIVKNKFSQVKIIINKKNLGFARANNIGIKQAIGDAIFLLNNDTVIDPQLIKRLVSELFKTENIGIVGPKIYFANTENIIWFAGGKIDWENFNSWHLNRNKTDQDLASDVLREVDFITGCALMIKKDVINKIGLLDNKFFAYYEDADWCQRAKKAGFKIVYVPFGGVWHIKSATARRYVSYRLKYNLWRNRFIFYWRYAPKKYRIKLLVEYIRSIIKKLFLKIYVK